MGQHYQMDVTHWGVCEMGQHYQMDVTHWGVCEMGQHYQMDVTHWGVCEMGQHYQMDVTHWGVCEMGQHYQMDVTHWGVCEMGQHYQMDVAHWGVCEMGQHYHMPGWMWHIEECVRWVSTTRWMWHIEECVRWVNTTRCLAECDTLRSVWDGSALPDAWLNVTHWGVSEATVILKHAFWWGKVMTKEVLLSVIVKAEQSLCGIPRPWPPCRRLTVSGWCHCVIAWERWGFVHSVLDYVSSDGFLVPNCVQFTSLTLQVLPLYFVVISCWLFLFEHVPLVEFTYLIFTRMPGESYHRRLRSLLLYLCYVFWVLINSLACWFCFCLSFVFGKSCVCTLLLLVDF